MTEYRHVTVAEPLGETWFNPNEAQFALIPRENGTVDHEAAQLVEGLVNTCIEGGEIADLDEFVHEMIDLHAQQIVLWPLGILWARTPTRRIEEAWFRRLLANVDPDFVQIREEILASGPLRLIPTPRGRQSLSFAYWKCLAAIRFASTGVFSLDDVQDAHVTALGEMFRPDGVWAEWAPLWTQKSIRYFARYLASERKDPHFGAWVTRSGTGPRGMRLEDVFAGARHLSWLDQAFERWLDEKKLLRKRTHRRVKRILAEVLSQRPPHDVSDPARAFSRENVMALLTVMETYSTPTSRVRELPYILEFARWLEDESRDQNGHPTFQIAFFQGDVDRFKNKVQRPQGLSAGSEVAARPMPARFHLELKKIICENDFAWPKSILSGQDGRPIHWITWRDPETGVTQPVFCEVLPRLLLLHLDLPLRNIQVRRLDSGEGDERHWDAATAKWVQSTGPHAGYWKRIGAKNPRRGVIREIASTFGNRASTITGLFINSNKTQDRGTLFDETSGYEIPWQLEDALENLSSMRSWQEKYNPVPGPLPFDQIKKDIFHEDPSEVIRPLVPERFYLFRYPQNTGQRGHEAPPSYKVFLQFFYDALEELERRLNEANPGEKITIITRRDKSGAPKKAIFTVHGMRSSILTSLYMEGVPIAVLSKLVAGHATILMTLKYAKLDPIHVSDILTDARRQALTKAAADFPNLLRNASFDEAARMTARLKDDGLAQIKGSYSEPTTWTRMDIGICPNGCTMCHVGGERIHRRIDQGVDKSAYRPVPGGARNCPRCRFFVTGLPFLIPLWGHANMVSARIDQIQARVASREKQREDLTQERYAANARGDAISPELRQSIASLEAEWTADMDARDQAIADLHATLVLIEKIRVIDSQEQRDADTRVPMLSRDDAFHEFNGRESTRFELADAVVQISRFFPSLEAPDLERERDAFLDRILYQEGYVPITLAPLSTRERQGAADALAKLLLSEVGAFEVQSVIEGRKTLSELGLQERLENIASRSIGRPLERLGQSVSAIAHSSNLVIDLQPRG